MTGQVIFGRKSSNSQDENLKHLTLKNTCRVGWYGSTEILDWAILFNMHTHSFESLLRDRDFGGGGRGL